jgi:molybdopterin synthase sulfur carrier subunit
MPKVVLASALTRWLSPGAARDVGEVALECDGERLDAVLARLFDAHPNLRGFVLDERGAVRHHVAIFVDGDAIRDKVGLQQPLRAESEVYVMQALSGG